MGTTPEAKLARNQRWRDQNREKLKEVNRAYYVANRDRLRAAAKERAARNPERKRAADRAYYVNHKRQRRREIIEALGGRCIRCGFGDWRGLQVDHVNGGGTRERESFSNLWSYYKRIAAHVESGEYQVLCANCNQIRRYEQGEDVQ